VVRVPGVYPGRPGRRGGTHAPPPAARLPGGPRRPRFSISTPPRLALGSPGVPGPRRPALQVLSLWHCGRQLLR
jgi:hypothetical protein